MSVIPCKCHTLTIPQTYVDQIKKIKKKNTLNYEEITFTILPKDYPCISNHIQTIDNKNKVE